MLGMVADTATNLIGRPVSGFCAVLYVCTAFILLTTTSKVAPRVASFTTCTWMNKIFRNISDIQQGCLYADKIKLMSEQPDKYSKSWTQHNVDNVNTEKWDHLKNTLTSSIRKSLTTCSRQLSFHFLVMLSHFSWKKINTTLCIKVKLEMMFLLWVLIFPFPLFLLHLFSWDAA